MQQPQTYDELHGVVMKCLRERLGDFDNIDENILLNLRQDIVQRVVAHLQHPGKQKLGVCVMTEAASMGQNKKGDAKPDVI